MLKGIRRMAGKLVGVLTSREFLTIAGMALVFGGELSEFAKRACYAVIAMGAIVGAGTLMSSLFSSSSAVIAMTGGF